MDIALTTLYTHVDSDSGCKDWKPKAKVYTFTDWHDSHRCSKVLNACKERDHHVMGWIPNTCTTPQFHAHTPKAASVSRSIPVPELSEQMMIMLQNAVNWRRGRVLSVVHLSLPDLDVAAMVVPRKVLRKYCVPAARPLAVTLGIQGCNHPQDNDMDRMFSIFFQDHAAAVVSHCLAHCTS